MKTKTDKQPKLTDTERHKRFVGMAKEVEASDDPKDFDKAFEIVTSKKTKAAKPKKPKKKPPTGSRPIGLLNLSKSLLRS
jgi:hypothetical protein